MPRIKEARSSKKKQEQKQLWKEYFEGLLDKEMQMNNIKGDI